MHRVHRGAEPGSLRQVRATHTRGWIRYYQDHRGNKPSDAYWRRFEQNLRKRFAGLCGYCEESCKGEIDHFFPKSRFPRRVYTWSNWIYACHTCNNCKGENWISGGYVNPCAISPLRWPEVYFTFDLKTGEIIPRAGLAARERERALTTAAQLRLNAFYHLKDRVYHLELIKAALSRARGEKRVALIALISSRRTQLSSLTRAYLISQRIVFP